jgi:hypothetical protein
MKENFFIKNRFYYFGFLSGRKYLNTGIKTQPGIFLIKKGLQFFENECGNFPDRFY